MKEMKGPFPSVFSTKTTAVTQRNPLQEPLKTTMPGTPLKAALSLHQKTQKLWWGWGSGHLIPWKKSPRKLIELLQPTTASTMNIPYQSRTTNRPVADDILDYTGDEYDFKERGEEQCWVG